MLKYANSFTVHRHKNHFFLLSEVKTGKLDENWESHFPHETITFSDENIKSPTLIVLISSFV